MKQPELILNTVSKSRPQGGTPDFRDGDDRIGGNNKKTQKIPRASTKTTQQLTLKIPMPNFWAFGNWFYEMDAM